MMQLRGRFSRSDRRNALVWDTAQEMGGFKFRFKYLFCFSSLLLPITAYSYKKVTLRVPYMTIVCLDLETLLISHSSKYQSPEGYHINKAATPYRWWISFVAAVRRVVTGNTRKQGCSDRFYQGLQDCDYLRSKRKLNPRKDLCKYIPSRD